MSGIIGRLRILLGLETAAFERGSKRAAAEVDALGTKMEKGAAKIDRISKAAIAAGAAIVGSAVVVQLKELVKQGLEYASALGEEAQQLGISTKNLQEYRYAATQVGLSQEEMDTSLAKLTKTMGQAVNGAKAPSAAFDKLGIDIKAFIASGKDAGDLLPLIAEGLQKIHSPAERAAVLVDLFGKSGQKLAPLLGEGAKGVNDLRDAAQKMGMVMSDSMIKKADDAADKMAALETLLKTRLAVAVAANADKILALADRLEQLAIKAERAWNWLNRLANSPFGKVVGWLNDKAGYANPLLMSGTLLDAATRAPAPSTPARAASGGVAAPLMQRTLPKTPGAWSGATPFKYRNTNLASSWQQFAPGAGITGGLEAIGGTAQQVETALGRMAVANDNAVERAELANSRIVRSFKEMADDTISALGRVADSVRGGGFLDILSSVLGLGLNLGGMGLFGKKVAASINATPRAAGGPALAGRLHLVGERGPELFVPGQSGTVVPNHALGGNTYNFSGNLMTPEFWGQIQAGDLAAANAGGQIGMARARQRGRWALR